MTSKTPISLLLFSMLMMSGCATGLQAENTTTPIILPVSPSIVRVRILTTRSASRITCPGSFRYGLRKGKTSHISPSSKKVLASGSTIIIGNIKFRGDVIISPINADDVLMMNGRRYRGSLVFHPLGKGRYDVVEYLTMSEYLYGVLPKEVNPTWPIESLKAQAIVSRSYAVANRLAREKERFDVSASVLDQVYGGREVESPDSNRAVDETAGQILVDPTGGAVRAFFHAACGGRTEMPERVWKARPVQNVYEIISDGDYCAEYPRHQWEFTLTHASLRERLRRAGLRFKTIKNVGILRKSDSDRAEVFLVEGTNTEAQVAGNRFRLALGPEALRSTYLTGISRSKRTITFKGRGWGHGVGMCQWGARGRALAGQDCSQILAAYYPKAKIARL